MKILGVGLSKTGTTSLHRALGVLGYKSLHYDERRLRDIIDGTDSTADYRRYDDVDAVLDIPAACFFVELMEAYPECKLVLTVRDENAWWRSIEAHFNQKAPVRSREQDPFKWKLRNYVYGSATAEEGLFRSRYRQHNQRVLESVPSDRLLVMDVSAGDGWEKLCPFLGVASPAVPFPHQNRQGESDVVYQRRAVGELMDVVPEVSIFILVDQNTIDVSLIENRQALPFLEHNGQYWGAPADDETAIRQCERLRGHGASHIVFAWPAFWWLDHYSEFYRHLQRRYECVLQNDRLVAFDLRNGVDAAPTGVE